jgi:gliding-associated putative ABC transporter substrate-binding component GldG
MIMNKKFFKQTDLTILVLVVIGIILVVNWFSYQMFYRWDLTQGKEYSLSATSKNFAGKLDDIVTIKVYFSKNLPSKYLPLRQQVGDILDEYVNYSKGKIKVQFVDPADDAKVADEVQSMGIPQVQFNIMDKDQYQLVKGYLGIAFSYGDKTETIPVVSETGNLEYQITLNIQKVMGKINASVGIADGGAGGDSGGITSAKKSLGELYQIEDINLKTFKEIPAGINTLVIAGSQEKLSDDQLKAIDAFVMRGGSLVVLAGGVNVGQGLTASASDTNIGDLTQKYGIQLNKDLVADVYSGTVSFNQGFMSFTTSYPMWPKVIQSGFDKDNPAVSRLGGVVLPWASSLDIIKDNLDQSDKVSYLAKSSDRSWRQTKDFNIDPQGATDTGADTRKSYNLAIYISGKINSAYGKGSTDNGRIVVVGNGNFMRDSFISSSPDNALFFQNLVDLASLQSDLINIRSKAITERPLKDVSESTKNMIRYFNIFGLTIIVVSFGLFRYFSRKRNKFADEI